MSVPHDIVHGHHENVVVDVLGERIRWVALALYGVRTYLFIFHGLVHEEHMCRDFFIEDEFLAQMIVERESEKMGVGTAWMMPSSCRRPRSTNDCATAVEKLNISASWAVTATEC